MNIDNYYLIAKFPNHFLYDFLEIIKVIEFDNLKYKLIEIHGLNLFGFYIENEYYESHKKEIELFWHSYHRWRMHLLQLYRKKTGKYPISKKDEIDELFLELSIHMISQL